MVEQGWGDFSAAEKTNQLLPEARMSNRVLEGLAGSDNEGKVCRAWGLPTWEGLEDVLGARPALVS